MKKKDLSFFYCRSCNKSLEIKVIDSKADDVQEGIFSCSGCGQWYPLTERIGFFLKNDYSFAEEFRQRFVKRHALKLENKNCDSEQLSIKEKNKQIEFFNIESDCYTYVHTMSQFVRLLDAQLLKFWGQYILENGVIIDLGCGTGMRTLPLAGQYTNSNIIGVDISIGMIRVALKHAQDKGLNNISFIVADADNLPFAAEITETVIGPGILHHVPEPKAVLREAQRVLKTNGCYLGIENNRSVFRFVFDFLQKIKPAWREEAGRHPLISVEELIRWGKEELLEISAHSRVFLPPQLINSLSLNMAEKVFNFSENTGRWLPFIRNHGGMLFIQGRKIVSRD
ncbi:MAG: methyltransferase domain-containing protein [Candidatus Omnitrophica bacterium]|nr:methyltransferase domain-containing protein [Candidatus Omnitrophota bacterium]